MIGKVYVEVASLPHAEVSVLTGMALELQLTLSRFTLISAVIRIWQLASARCSGLNS